MYTIKQIIINQKSYRKFILKWLNDDLRKTKKELLNINSDDEYISSQVEKLKKKFKKPMLKLSV